jgi:peptide/nickel transport system substrate-binding protein
MAMDRRGFLRESAVLAAGGALSLAGGRTVYAQTRADTLLLVQEGGPNNLDISQRGVNRPANGASWNVYDRLVTFADKRLADGGLTYDYSTLRGELAERFEVSADGRVLTFHLRRNAVFHDGAPVTANDVKWSFDRAVSLPNSASKGQFALGSMEDPGQFTVVDPYTFRITLPRADRYTLPNLATHYAFIVNAELARKNATAADPWAADWLKQNVAGGGAYKVESWQPGKQLVLGRHDGWKSGALPYFRRVILQEIPEAGNRRALVERADADVGQDLLAKDVVSIIDGKKLKVFSTPMANTLQFIALNCKMKPFDDVRVRRAIAYALPYDAILRGAASGRGAKLYGAASSKPTSTEWPQPSPYSTNVAQAKKLLAEAGYPQGFSTTFSYSSATASVDETVAILVQEALAEIGVKVTLDKIPGAQILGKLQAKEVPMYAYQTAALLNDTDYFFRVFYHGSNGPWNFGNFVNDEVTKLIDDARWEASAAKYDAMCRRMIEIAFEQVPLIPLWQPMLDFVAQPNLTGYKYWFHRQLDVRPLKRV